MDLSAILLLLALLLGVGLYLAAPLLGRRADGEAETDRELSGLLAERERVVNALQELDFDFRLGKIPQEDYPDQRAELLQKGAAVLKKLDAAQPAASAAGDAETRLEQAAAAGRVDAGPRDAQLSDDEIESLLAARRKARKTKSAGFCPNCGKSILLTDQFCPNCGKRLK